MTSSDLPRRGEIWLCALGAARSGEPGKTRPALVVSPAELQSGSARELVVVVPLSATLVGSALRPIVTASSGVDADSVATTPAIRGVARSRLLKRIGRASSSEMIAVDQAMRFALGLN